MTDFADKLREAEPSGPAMLEKERKESSIPVEELSQHLLGHDGFLERQKRILRILEKEKLLSKATQPNLARPDRFRLGLARAKLLRRLADKHGWNYEDYRMAEYLVDDVSPFHLHLSMFITTIKEQGSDEQQKYWLPLIESWKIIGSYGQTELGHGSNVKGLECQAIWDNDKKEFTIHSPTLTASKWWNGALGRTATHTIVVAQLMLPTGNGKELKSHGPHTFIVQVRDSETHKPLPGLALGDIGPKYGYPAMDNAYLLFDNFKVPHSAMLSRYFQVDKNTGKYTSQAQDPAVVYGSLTFVRVSIVMHARLVLARAVTVAVRYLSIRRQFQDRDHRGEGGDEMQVLDYPTVQMRVLPLLATTYALHYSGIAMGEQYETTRRSIESGDFSALADMHATSSGLKSLCTTLAADGIETCRRACGGHGFGGGSGLIQLNNDYLSKPTVEGDNYMITQQTASYLIKQVTAVLDRLASSPKSEPENHTQATIQNYLTLQQSNKLSPLSILRNDEALAAAFERRAAHLAVALHTARVTHKKPWTALLIQLHHASNAHSQALLVRNFFTALFSPAPYSPSPSSISPPPFAARGAMLAAYRLFALNTLQTNLHDFVAARAVTSSVADALPEHILKLMGRIRRDAVAMVDAWRVPDYLLDSALGRSDGRVYETLFDMAHRRNPLNAVTANPRYWEKEVTMGKGDDGLEAEELVVERWRSKL